MIIGISAKIGCGKSTLAKLFIEKHPEYTRIAFGDLLKQECSETYRYPLNWNYNEQGKQNLVFCPEWPYEMTVRQCLQWHGTDYRRTQDPDYWIKKMQGKLNSGEIQSHVIVDDVRFKNEAKMIKKLNGKLIRLNPYLGWRPCLYADHRSETDLDDYESFDLILNPKFGELDKCVPEIR